MTATTGPVIGQSVVWRGHPGEIQAFLTAYSKDDRPVDVLARVRFENDNELVVSLGEVEIA